MTILLIALAVVGADLIWRWLNTPGQIVNGKWRRK